MLRTKARQLWKKAEPMDSKTKARAQAVYDRSVRARAPLRLGLAGGGTDVSPYCDEHGGAVLNITIHRFAYAFIEPRHDNRIELRSNDLSLIESYDSVPQISSDTAMTLHRGVYNRIVREFNGGHPLPITLTTHADAPAGSGLGTSSSLVVALVDAFRAYLDLPLGRYDVARLAFEIERNDLGLAGGRQDQYAAAFGGVNFIEFLAHDRVIVNPLRLSAGILDELEASVLTCFTGQSRESANIINEQTSHMTARTPTVIEALHELKASALAMKSALLTGDIPEIADIMDQAWRAKKLTAASISNPMIEQLYDFAMSNGAIAGKVSGAGGGGFVMFIAAPDHRAQLVRKLREFGADAQAAQFTSLGSETWIKPY
jgi:D-glycero-alpha-D-manno-heptose-7-phosphate kinase